MVNANRTHHRTYEKVAVRAVRTNRISMQHQLVCPNLESEPESENLDAGKHSRDVKVLPALVAGIEVIHNGVLVGLWLEVGDDAFNPLLRLGRPVPPATESRCQSNCGAFVHGLLPHPLLFVVRQAPPVPWDHNKMPLDRQTELGADAYTTWKSE